ncbi:hypothetical protein SAMN04487866_1353 [Thermoactinomyces sp. DSM 45891]|uniref:hypothetical protein n=1 Tax=Thermoactinomyces sp. DSM 45891 TaxID=1761907 RepID=UPI0009194B08|nr:hypothetical protein [Thermoactinomyces sp. DSM 45891]SFX83299.1 hypothetical protein SAMN04487866_1353 [Thermoactinomyces sp. DSM 45891]
MEAKMKELVIESIRESRKETLNHLKFIIHEYPYHPDTKFFLLEVRGHRGDFGVSITAMNGWEEQLTKNAHGEPDTALVGFGFDSMSKLSYQEVVKNLDLVDEIDSLTKDYLPIFFQECFNEAGGKESRIPYYLFYPNSGEAYDLVKEEWPDYVEGLDA